MAHVQNTGFHRSRAAAAASARVMRKAGSAGTISDRLRRKVAADAAGSTPTTHTVRTASGSAPTTALTATDSTADKGMQMAVREAPSEAKNCCHDA